MYGNEDGTCHRSRQNMSISIMHMYQGNTITSKISMKEDGRHISQTFRKNYQSLDSFQVYHV
jgi:hypothetical protein